MWKRTQHKLGEWVGVWLAVFIGSLVASSSAIQWVKCVAVGNVPTVMHSAVRMELEDFHLRFQLPGGWYSPFLASYGSPWNCKLPMDMPESLIKVGYFSVFHGIEIKLAVDPLFGCPVRV